MPKFENAARLAIVAGLCASVVCAPVAAIAEELAIADHPAPAAEAGSTIGEPADDASGATPAPAAEVDGASIDTLVKLQQAFENAQDGVETTITLDADIECNVGEVATVPSGKIIVLDMAKHKITCVGSYKGRPIVNEGSLLVKGDGTIDTSMSQSGGYGAINNKGTLEIANGTFKGAKYAGGSCIRNTGASAILTANGGTFSGATCAIYNEGIATLNDGSYVGTTCSSCNSQVWGYTIQNATKESRMVINGGYYEGVQGAVSAAIGSLIVNDGTFKAVACKENSAHAATFYALYAAGENGNVYCEVNGGIFENEGKRPAAVVGNDNKGGDGGINADATARIYGGTFKTNGTDPALSIAKETGSGVVAGGTFLSNGKPSVIDDKYLAPGMKIDATTGSVVVDKDVEAIATITRAGNVIGVYDSLEKAVCAAGKGETVELNSSIKVAEWNQIWPDDAASALDGITIDGKGNALTIDKLSSNGNGDYLFYEAKNLTVKNLTINQPANAHGLSMQSGTVEGVVINGGKMGVVMGAGDVTVTGSAFNNVSQHALYTESETGNAVIKDNTFVGCDYVAILTKSGSEFTGNAISGGKLNIMHAGTKVQSNVFDGASRVKFYAEPAEGVFIKNDISPDTAVVLGNGVAKANLNGNYWGSADGPAAGQLPAGATVTEWYEDEDMTHLNTDPETFKVTFVLNNGDADKSVEVEEGKTVAKPADPTRKGYTFAGWYADPAFKVAFDFSAAISTDTTVYAKWVKDEVPAPIVHKVTFVPVVGGDEATVVEVKDGEFVELPKTPEIEGYTFAGWFLDKDFKMPFDAEKTTITGDLTLYGGWYADGSEEPAVPQKPEVDKPGDTPSAKPELPKTGDASALPIAAAGVAGVAAVAAGVTVSVKRRKAE